jgi:hypothetical protein
MVVYEYFALMSEMRCAISGGKTPQKALKKNAIAIMARMALFAGELRDTKKARARRSRKGQRPACAFTAAAFTPARFGSEWVKKTFHRPAASK